MLREALLLAAQICITHAAHHAPPPPGGHVDEVVFVGCVAGVQSERKTDWTSGASSLTDCAFVCDKSAYFTVLADGVCQCVSSFKAAAGAVASPDAVAPVPTQTCSAGVPVYTQTLCALDTFFEPLGVYDESGGGGAKWRGSLHLGKWVMNARIELDWGGLPVTITSVWNGDFADRAVTGPRTTLFLKGNHNSGVLPDVG